MIELDVQDFSQQHHGPARWAPRFGVEIDGHFFFFFDDFRVYFPGGRNRGFFLSTYKYRQICMHKQNPKGSNQSEIYEFTYQGSLYLGTVVDTVRLQSLKSRD